MLRLHSQNCPPNLVDQCSEGAITMLGPGKAEDTLSAINSLKALMTPGPDCIPGDLYKSEPGLWDSYVNILSNAIASGREILDTWGGAEITPLFKKEMITVCQIVGPLA